MILGHVQLEGDPAADTEHTGRSHLLQAYQEEKNDVAREKGI